MDFRGRTPGKLGMEWGKGDIPALSAGNVKKGFIDFSAECYFGSEELYRRWMTRGDVSKGDVVFTTEAPLGNVALIPDNKRYILSQRTILIRTRPERALSAYLFQTLLSDGFQKVLADNASGSTAKGIQRKRFEQLTIALPPAEEQRAIATALSDVDALIDGLAQLIAKKRDLKQAAMQQLLTGQTRLPGFNGEWSKKLIGEISEVKTGPFGSSLHESDYVKVGTPIITVEHLGEFGVEHVNLPLVSEADRQRLIAYSLSEGDIVFSRVGSVDRNALIRRTETGWLFSGRLLRVRPDKATVHAPFLSHQFHGEAFKASVRSVAVGQTMASLNTQILNDLFVMLPSMAEQIAIAAVLSDMDAELAALDARLVKTRALKQAMMQELLTGKTRLI
ncbi:MAG TPA: restriction endonuclease subunit S [Acidovorax temperans]|nr:restriction endonuclease subunit S [Acidovorax temperans]